MDRDTEETLEEEVLNEETTGKETAEDEATEVQNPMEIQPASDTDEIFRERKQAEMQIDPRYNGLGGWLILVMIGLFITPIRLSFFVAGNLLPLFTEGTFEQLITPGTEFFHPLWLPLLLYEVCANAFLAIYAIVILVYFFRRKKILPKLMIAFYALNILMIVIDEVMCSFIPFIAGQSDPSSYTELVRSIISGAIWIPYFCVSVRVRSTFIR